MKKLFCALAVLLTVICMMSFCAFAADVVPGINLLTGTEEPMTFDGMDELPSNITRAALAESPVLGDYGNAIVSTSTGTYGVIILDLGASVPCERDMYISFKAYNKAAEGYETLKNFWFLKNGGSPWQIAWVLSSAVQNGNHEWKTYEKLVTTFDTLTNNGNIDRSPTSKVLIEWEHTDDKAYLENQIIYIDDVSVIPAYKVTYIGKDGKTYKEEYVYPDSDSFTPAVTAADKEDYIIGWAEEADGEPIKSVSLENKDITLYAIYDESVNIALETDINLLDMEGAQTTISASAHCMNGIDGITFEYSVAEGADFVTLTDNADGTATVVSKAEGLSKVVYTASTGEVGELYILSDYSESTKDVRIVRVLRKADEISVDSQTAEVCAELFSNASGKRTLSWKLSDYSVASIVATSGTTALVSPVKNGNVTVTVCDADNEDICDSFDIEISNQREKYPVYDIRIQFWGCSTARHGASSALAWTGNWGMAASSEDKDYVHRLVARLEEEFYPSKVTFDVVATSAYDQEVSADTDSEKDYSNVNSFVDIMRAVEQNKPNIIVTGQTENIRDTVKEDCLLNAYTQVYDTMYELVPDAIILAQHCAIDHRDYIETLHANLVDRYKNMGKVFINYDADLPGHPEFYASEWLLLNPPQPGVAAHPGDKGMDELARVECEYLVPYIRSMLEPTYIYLPESISITGDDEITTEAGSVKLKAVAYPSDASKDVIWSIDNTDIAVINDSGILTAIYDGTVTVTAKSKYNDEVLATHTVTITGQPKASGVYYDKNTTDEVYGMPENEQFAKGEYVLSENRPLRDCYTFAGWSLTPDAAEFVSSVTVSEDTTVYAIWEKTTGFEFEGTYDENFGYIYGFDIVGGFHAEVSNSKMSAICTAGEKVRFNSPRVDIKNTGYISFALESAYTDSTATVELTVNTANDSKTYVYPLTTEKVTTYVADTSALSGNITDFSIYVNAAPENGTMFSIYIDYVRFGVNRKLDASEGEFSLSDGNITVSSSEHAYAYEVSGAQFNSDAVLVAFDSGSGIELKDLGEDSVLYIGANADGASLTVTTRRNGTSGRYEPAASKVYTALAEGFAEDALVSEVLTSYDRASIRVKDPQGMRVMASVTPEFYTQEDVLEYGFVVTKLETLESGRIRDLVADEEYLSANLVQKGASFSRQSGKHIIYEADAEKEIFTAAFINIPESKAAYETKLAFRPYIKLDDGRMIYGACTSRSLYDIALSIILDKTADSDSKAVAEKIFEVCDVQMSEDETYVDSGALFG